MVFREAGMLASIGLCAALYPATLAPIGPFVDARTPYPHPLITQNIDAIPIKPIRIAGTLPNEVPPTIRSKQKSPLLEADLPSVNIDFRHAHIDTLIASGSVRIVLPEGREVMLIAKKVGAGNVSAARDTDVQNAEIAYARDTDVQNAEAAHVKDTDLQRPERIHVSIGEYSSVITRRGAHFFATLTTQNASYRVQGGHRQTVAYVQRYFADRSVARDFAAHPDLDPNS